VTRAEAVAAVAIAVLFLVVVLIFVGEQMQAHQALAAEREMRIDAEELVLALMARADEEAAERAEEVGACTANVGDLLGRLERCGLASARWAGLVDTVTEESRQERAARHQILWHLGWCKRDRAAAQCALGGEPACEPVAIGWGGSP